MEQRNKNCRKCKEQFIIEKEDEDFYTKMNVPHPTLCPPCRMQRKMCFRNERTLYKTKCAFSNQDMLSVYPPTTKYTVYEQKYGGQISGMPLITAWISILISHSLSSLKSFA